MDRQAEIYILLEQLDWKLIRPLSEGDTVRIAAINAEKAALRAELNALQQN